MSIGQEAVGMVRVIFYILLLPIMVLYKLIKYYGGWK